MVEPLFLQATCTVARSNLANSGYSSLGMYCGRYGEVVLEDLAKMSLADPSNPKELRLGKVAPVTFESVAHREHKWQVDISLFKNACVLVLCAER